MPVEIACGNCGQAFGVEPDWAGLAVECPFCQTAVQVPDEVAQFGEPATELAVDSGRNEPVPAKSSEPIDFQELASESNVGTVGTRSAKRPKSNATPEKTAHSKSRRQVEQETQSVKPRRQAESEIQPATKHKLGEKPQVAAKPPAVKPTAAKSAPPKPVSTPSARAASAPISSVAPVPAPRSETHAVSSPPASDTPPPVEEPIAVPVWTLPPTIAWLNNAKDHEREKLRVVVNSGLTTIQYQGQKVVLRDQPEVRQWYGNIVFVLSVLTLTLVLTLLYFIYR